ncbi:hypothetical protein [Leucobacter aridicollis]|uniref:hypothetical protein n=1 Tax=Leucobacter aridicollis TaxID=283878 RepID=UPI002107BCFD|nr:hypothetical protein [Leucobacter aridicollis]UTX52855.1 hypothetical protein KI794_14225 [Leucobacter aridicollis]
MSRVLLLGGGISAFAAALDLAEVGVTVVIVDSVVRLPEIPVRHAGGEVSALLDVVAAPLAADGAANPEAAPRLIEAANVMLRTRGGGWAASPARSVWGIPPVPLAKACMALLGTGGALRAYLDRLKPVLTIGKEHNFGALVDSRLGSNAREILVEPFVVEGFGVQSHRSEPALVEPGLNEALTRAGSLSGAAELQFDEHTSREQIVEPHGGWPRFGELLVERLRLFGAEHFAGEVAACVRESDGRWAVTDDSGTTQRFDAVIGELDAVEATASVGAQEAAVAWPRDEQIVTDAPRTSLHSLLAEARPTTTRQYAETRIQGLPSGVVAGTDALAVIVSAAGDPWAARLTSDAEGESVLRLTGPAEPLGGTGQPPIAEAVEKLGVQLMPEASVSHTTLAAPFATDAERDARREAREAVNREYPTLLLAGEDLHGGSLGAALSELRPAAVHLRRKLTGIAE